jgi:hypothetical protein
LLTVRPPFLQLQCSTWESFYGANCTSILPVWTCGERTELSLFYLFLIVLRETARFVLRKYCSSKNERAVQLQFLLPEHTEDCWNGLILCSYAAGVNLCERLPECPRLKRQQTGKVKRPAVFAPFSSDEHVCYVLPLATTGPDAGIHRIDHQQLPQPRRACAFCATRVDCTSSSRSGRPLTAWELVYSLFISDLFDVLLLSMRGWWLTGATRLEDWRRGGA